MNVLNSFVSIDFEVLTSYRHSICSVGAVKYINSEMVDSYYTLIQPKWDSINENAMSFTHIHGITESELTDKPTWPEVLPVLEKFIGNMMLVAHNAMFERSCFKAANELYGLTTTIDYKNIIDTLKITKICEKKLGLYVPNEKGRHTLNTLCLMYGISMSGLDHHNALSDSIMGARLLNRMNEILLMSDEERKKLNITIPEPIIEEHMKDSGTVGLEDIFL